MAFGGNNIEVVFRRWPEFLKIFMIFLKLAEVEGNFYRQKTIHSAIHFYIIKPNHFALRFYIQKAIHFASRLYIVEARNFASCVYKGKARKFLLPDWTIIISISCIFWYRYAKIQTLCISCFLYKKIAIGIYIQKVLFKDWLYFWDLLDEI